MRLPVLSFLAAAAISLTAQAQTFRGGITGIVTDASDAAVTSAKVTATNEATTLSYNTPSSSDGVFTFQDLPLGTYTVQVEAAGFQTRRIDNVHVSAGMV